MENWDEIMQNGHRVNEWNKQKGLLQRTFNTSRAIFMSTRPSSFEQRSDFEAGEPGKKNSSVSFSWTLVI